MFDKLVESTTAKKKSRGGFFIATATIWMLVLSTTIVAGIFAFDGRLSDYEKALIIVTPPPPPPPPPGDNRNRNYDRPNPTGQLVATQTPPDRISPPETRPPLSDLSLSDSGSGSGATGGVPGGVPEGVLGGVPFGMKNGVVPDAPPPPPRQPDPPKEETEKPVQKKATVRSVILQGAAVKRVEPAYPVIARQVKAQGSVIIELTINEQGAVESARAISGHPLLREPALNAARAWRWNPTILNGVPVKVIGTITFNFRL